MVRVFNSSHSSAHVRDKWENRQNRWMEGGQTVPLPGVTDVRATSTLKS